MVASSTSSKVVNLKCSFSRSVFKTWLISPWLIPEMMRGKPSISCHCSASWITAPFSAISGNPCSPNVFCKYSISAEVLLLQRMTGTFASRKRLSQRAVGCQS
ncbi:Uncharacterised protein [Shigella sonnei]|nr:Uncharacterised protein [Shigella sonnei]